MLKGPADSLLGGTGPIFQQGLSNNAFSPAMAFLGVRDHSSRDPDYPPYRFRAASILRCEDVAGDAPGSVATAEITYGKAFGPQV